MKALVKGHPRPGLSLLDIGPPRIENSDDIMFKVGYCALCIGKIKV